MNTQEMPLIEESHTHSKIADVCPEGHRSTGQTPATPTTNIPSTTQVNSTKPRRSFDTAYKLKILAEYDACDNALARGELLRKAGLYSSRISTWKKQLKEGKLGKKTKQRIHLQNEKLLHENKQLKKKLARAEAIIDLQKKLSDLFGQHILPKQMSEENS